MSTKRLFALAFYAGRTREGKRLWSTVFEVGHALGFVQAHSEDEAIGMGLRMAKERFPEGEGFEGHAAVAVEAPDVDATTALPDPTPGTGREGERP